MEGGVFASFAFNLQSYCSEVYIDNSRSRNLTLKYCILLQVYVMVLSG